MTSGITVRRWLLLAIFTVSGFSGLIYESIWSHYLKLFLGHAAYAQTLVLAIFMGGMALGSWLVARNSHRLKSLLLGYAVVEGLTGLLALVFHSAHVGATNLAFDTVIPALHSIASIQLFKWTLAALLILPQSILMGSTFPLISGGLIRRYPDSSGATLSMLYFTNSLGAALGVLVSGFVLIERVGLPGTVMAAGMLNILLAVVVWLMARHSPEPMPVAAQAGAVMTLGPAGRWLLLAAALAGLAAFVYEIAWIRMLSLVLGASTHAFELMLSAFILGLALGGLWVRKRMDRWAEPLRALAVMFALMAVCAALTLPAYGSAFDVMAGALRMFGRTEAGYAGFNLVSHAIATVLMIPTTFIAGMTLPLMTHWLYRSGGGERAIGAVYAANTLGAIIGVMLAVHLLLPVVGTKGAIIAGAAVQIAVAVLFLLRSRGGLRPRASAWVTAGSAALVLLVAALVHLDPLRMASGVYRNGVAQLSGNIRVSYLKDGKTATITLARDGDTVYIATNGKTDAAINMGAGPPAADEITMVMAAALPLALHAAPARVANIGIGSGLTSQAVLASPRVQQLDSIEIEPAMAEAAKLGFGARVARLYDDPRSRIHFEDAKSFFAAAGAPYDVIISEPSNPWVSGVATLFSDEYYRQIRRYLRDDGLLVQWLQIYETDVTIVASVIKALAPHFSDYAVYNTDDTDILIVARKQGKLPELDARIFAEPLLQAELRHVGLTAPVQLALRRIADKRHMDALVATYTTPANSDYFPFVDLNAPRMRYLGRDALALSFLNSLPVPLARLLGAGIEPATGLAGVQSSTSLNRELRMQSALRLAAALQSGEVSALAPEAAAEVLLARDPSLDCKAAATRRAWLAAVTGVHERSTSFLDAAAGGALWTELRGHACAVRADGDDRRWLDFMQAMATGTRAEVAAQGLAWLQAPDAALTAQQMAEVLVGTTAALIGEQRHGEALRLLQRYVPLIGDPGRYELAIRMLTGLAAT
jgi:spermidine synthase